MRKRRSSRLCGLKFVFAQSKHITQTQHGIERIEVREFYVLRRLVGIDFLRPGDKFGVTPDYARVVAPYITRAERQVAREGRVKTNISTTASAITP